MLNLLLGNRLLAFFFLCAAICLDRSSQAPANDVSGDRSSRMVEFLAGAAFVAWAVVVAGWAPAFQIVFNASATSLVGFDSQDPIGWLAFSMGLFAVFHRLKWVSLDPRFFFWAIVAAAIADDRLLSWSFTTGGVHAFHPHEGLFGLIFFLYPIAAFSGRMGIVGRCLGLGLVTLGFGLMPAALLFFGLEHRPQSPVIGRMLGSAALASGGLIGLEELGGLGRGAAVPIATGVFVVLSLAWTKRSTEVRA